jgi:hypothetical protein
VIEVDPTIAPDDARRRLEAFVVDPESAALPPVALLERIRLAAYAYTAIASDHPARERLLPAFLRSKTAHALAVAALEPLVAAWRESGIDVLAFKGLALALATYPQPAQRFYDDADVLIRDRDAVAAQRLATNLGWSVRRNVERTGKAYAHESGLLASPDGRLDLDVHRLVLHSSAPWQAVPRRFTDGAWSASREVPLGRTRVRVLDARDAVLIGVVLNRCWSGDDWRLKARDYVDIRTLVEQHGVDEASLTARARELRCLRTLQSFLARCDPYRKHLDLRPPSLRRRWWWSLRVAHERRPARLERTLLLPLKAPGVMIDVARVLPVLLRVLWLLRRERDVYRLLERLDAPAAAAVSPAATAVTASGSRVPWWASPVRGFTELPPARQHYHVVRGVRWALRLLRVRRGAECLPRSLTVFVQLRRLGHAVVFVSGVRQSASGLQGHAWVELDGNVLPELAEPRDVRFVANLRYPAATDGHVGSGGEHVAPRRLSGETRVERTGRWR